MLRLVTAGLLTIALSFQVAFAQVVEVRDVSGTVVNGTTVSVSGLSNAVQIIEHLDVENKSGSSQTIKLKRYEVSVTPATMNYFCWSVCYLPKTAGTDPLWIDPDPVVMVSDSTYKNFSAYHKPETLTGTSTYRYVWYDDNNSNDSTWVDIEFNIAQAPVGIGKPDDEIIEKIEVKPNPARAYTIFDFGSTMDNGTILEIYSRNGVLVNSINVSHLESYVFNTSHLTSGSYIFKVRTGKSLVGRGRLVVTQ